MSTFGVLLILFGVTIAWLLGVKGLSIDQAIQDVQGTLQVGQPFVAQQPIQNQGQANG